MEFRVQIGDNMLDYDGIDYCIDDVIVFEDLDGVAAYLGISQYELEQEIKNALPLRAE